jgi:hypothetical protein
VQREGRGLKGAEDLIRPKLNGRKKTIADFVQQYFEENDQYFWFINLTATKVCGGRISKKRWKHWKRRAYYERNCCRI